MKQCQKCGSTELDNDPSKGALICLSCGYLVESQSIVSELTFANNAVHGTFLNSSKG